MRGRAGRPVSIGEEKKARPLFAEQGAWEGVSMTTLPPKRLVLRSLKSTISEIIRWNMKWISLRSVAGLVIQATGGMEFEDGLRPGSPWEVLCDLLSVSSQH